MANTRELKPIGDWFGEEIPLGESRDVSLAVGESYSSMTVQIPIHIRRATVEGPVVFVTAALHGDEINGTGAIRELINDPDFQLKKGTVILIPVLNLLAFDRHSRYLPDRRDLNRCFPGSSKGSLAGRMARVIFKEIVSRCDYGIDLHTAAIRRTNYPNVRGDLSDPEVRKLADAFGAEVVINGKGPTGSFRREACKSGCPTIIMEGGEVWKVEPGVVEAATRGVRNVLRSLGMLDGAIVRPNTQMIVSKTKWIRAERGGFLQFHIAPGDVISKGSSVATNTTLLGRETSVLQSPFDAVVIGMTSLPAVSPGEPVCNLGRLPRGIKPEDILRLRSEHDGLEQQLTDELGSSVLVFERQSGESTAASGD